ncbi:MAG TPA: NUDIX domain-containing protein [Acidimicrobiia bacterium]|nr:NUDIX domain-containing protein [Acidimicrobiia bacterium]
MSDANEKTRAWARRLGTTPTEPQTQTIPAATVVLLRDGTAGLETLVLLRNSKLAFAGGMWVFPGGRVDPGDGDRSVDELGVARRAAAREAQEEAGLDIDPDGLVTYAHWCPPAFAPKRFATWFFVTAAPPGDVVVDGGEIHAHRWVRPADGLARRDAGEIELAPPTWVTLHDLARFTTVEETLDAVRAREPESFVTRIAAVGGAIVAMWHGDSGYEAGDADRPGGRHRLWMADAGWRYERS